MLVYVGEIYIVRFVESYPVIVGSAFLCICIFIVIVSETYYFLFGGGFIYEYVMLRGICVSLCEFA